MRISVLRISGGVLILAVGWLLLAMHRDVERLQTAVMELEMERARERREAEPVSPLLLDFHLELPGRGEVFPAMANAVAAEAVPLALLNITNTANKPVAQIIEAEIPGWSRSLKQTEIIGPKETRLVRIQPALLPQALRNQEIRTEQLDVSVTGVDGSILFAESRPVLIHGGSELLWGHKFRNAQVAARWVTPHDPAVLDLVSRARRYVPRGRMAGYGARGTDPAVVSRHVREQAEAVFRVLKESGISYVNSLFVMGEYLDQAQRVRLPHETLALKSANCMDVSVVFASAMENLGLQPLLVMAYRLSMGNSLEVRNPFLDHRVIEFSARVSDELKFRNGQGKWLLRRALERLVGPDLGITRRTVKHGLPAPVNQWLFKSSAFDRNDWNHVLLGECLKQLARVHDPWE